MLYSDIDHFSEALLLQFDQEMEDYGLQGTFGFEIEFFAIAATNKDFSAYLFDVRESLYNSDTKYHRFNLETGNLQKNRKHTLAEVSTKVAASAVEALQNVKNTQRIIHNIANDRNIEII